MRKPYIPGICRVTETPSDYEEIRSKYPKGYKLILNGYGGVAVAEAMVVGHRRTKYQGTLIMVEYSYTWPDGYSRICRACISKSEILRQPVAGKRPGQ